VLRKRLAENPRAGVSVNQLDTREACKKVIGAYWNAVIAKDWDAVQRLRPLATGKSLTDLKTLYAAHEPIEKVNISKVNHLDDPGTFAEAFCVLGMKDGSTLHSLLNVDLQEAPAGRIGVVAGSIGPEFYSAE
jgi:hypothetical protein